MIFIDADAFIGLNIKKDAHYQRANAILIEIKEDGKKLVTSWDVIDEVATKISYYDKRETSISFLESIIKGNIKIIFPDKKIAKKAFKIFKKQTSKKVSLTDCTNMAIAEIKGIKKFFSFDKVYEKNGFKLL